MEVMEDQLGSTKLPKVNGLIRYGSSIMAWLALLNLEQTQECDPVSMEATVLTQDTSTFPVAE